MNNKKSEKLVQLVSYSVVDKKQSRTSKVQKKTSICEEGHGKALRETSFLRRSLIEDEENCLSIL
ncbi:hypothetical protein ABMA79_08855 [Halobacteriovorax sp. HFRX-2_2]|uniref:hypothetical protein n=1 Tax=unclassified Halobacteriovorax TaxID=2639665 RepID=UPI003710C3B9